MRKFLVAFIFLIAAWTMNAQNPRLTVNTIAYNPAPSHVINFWQYTPPNYNNTELFPLIVSLHGGGQAGESIAEINNVLTDGLPFDVNGGTGARHDLVFSYTNNGVTTTAGFVLLAPQATRGEVGYWPTYYVDQMIAYGIANLRVDPNRVFLVGFSNGGAGVWNYASSSTGAAAKLAGIAPASSSGADGGNNYCNIGSQQVAVWTFHGGSDGTVPALNDKTYADAVNGCSPLIPAVDSIYANENHGIYESVVYDYGNKAHYPNVFQWMLRVNRSINLSSDQAPVPVISLGTNTTLNLTTPVKVKDIVLDGTGSHDDDIIMDYLWENNARPANISLAIDSTQWPRAHLSASTPAYLTALGLIPGTYAFRLRVKDYLTSAVYGANNHTQFANLNIVVSYPASGFSAPVTDAGANVTIPSNQTTVTGRSGQAQSYPCGSCNVTAYNWRQISGPPATLSNFSNNGPYGGGDNNVSFTNLNSSNFAIYQFEFSATTAHGDIGRDTVSIIKLGALPVSYAYFNGQNAGSKNVLTWATTAEVNSDRFDIQRSTDGTNFNIIGSVRSTGGAAVTTYSFEDNNAPAGIAYYRLLQVDKDGHSSQSQVVSLNNRRTGIYVDKYPNPVHDNLTVTVKGTLNGTVQVIVADMQGKAILQQHWQKDIPSSKKIMAVGGLQNGVYQMIITIGQEKQVSSFVKY